MKAIKGNVIAIDSFVGKEYWEKRNGNADRDETIQPLVDQTKQAMAELLADPILFDLHQKSVAYHQAEIKNLRANKVTLDLFESIKTSHNETKSVVNSEETP